MNSRRLTDRNSLLAGAMLSCLWTLPLSARTFLAGDPPPAVREQCTEIPARDQKSAAEILAMAGDAQAGTSDRKLGTTPLTLATEMRIRHKEGKDEIDVELLAKRRFKAPSLIWTELTEPATLTVTREGFDGTKAWFWKDGNITYYTAGEYRLDMLKLQRDIDEMLLLGKAFLLYNLPAELESMARLADVNVFGRDAYTLDCVSKKNLHTRWGQPVLPDPANPASAVPSEQKPVLRLWIGRENHELVGCSWTEGDLLLCLAFSKHRPNPEGVLVPMQIEIYRAGETEWSDRIHFKNLTFQPKLEAAQFRADAK